MKIYRIARWVVLAGLVVSVFLLFKTPDPVSRPQDSRTVASNVESYQTKLQQLQDAKEHVMISTHNGALKIDVTDPEEDVHIVCPLATIEDITQQIGETGPGA